MRKDVILSIFKGILVLSAIALICTVLLGVFNIVTYIDPLQSAYNNFAKYSSNKQYTKMLEENWSTQNAKILYYAQSTDGTTNAFLSRGNGGYGGPVEVYLIINVSTTVIERVELGNHSETYIPNLNSSGYFNQILDHKITDLQDNSIDHTSGATWSSRAIERAVLAVADYYQAYPDKVQDQTKTKNSVQTDSKTRVNKNQLINSSARENQIPFYQEKIVQNKQGGLL